MHHAADWDSSRSGRLYGAFLLCCQFPRCIQTVLYNIQSFISTALLRNDPEVRKSLYIGMVHTSNHAFMLSPFPPLRPPANPSIHQNPHRLPPFHLSPTLRSFSELRIDLEHYTADWLDGHFSISEEVLDKRNMHGLWAVGAAKGGSQI